MPALRPPDDAGGDLPAASGDATSKSAVSRRFVALTRSKLKAWLASPLDDLDLVVLQIAGSMSAINGGGDRLDTGGAKHVLGLAEGATENAATVQAMLDNLKPSGMEKATEPARAERKAGRRGGKIDRLVIDEERVLKAAVRPPARGSRDTRPTWCGRQELILRPHVIRYRREF